MKLVKKQIEVICHCISGKIIPIKFKVLDEDGASNVIVVHRIYTTKEEKKNGNLMKYFRCESNFNNKILVYELVYEYKNCMWYLYKI